MMKGPFNSKFIEGAFTLPCKWELSSLLNGDEKVAVVSIVGQSEIEDGCDKTTPLSFILSRSISSCSSLVPLQLDESLVHLEGWYDSSRHTIFLHLVAAQDLALFAGGVQVIDDLLREKDFLDGQNLLEQQYLRALVLVFSLSHIILWKSTTHLLDTDTITTLRSLNNIRTAVLPHATTVLQELPGLGRTWAAAGRLCCPRMLFIFSSALLDAEQMAEEMTVDRTEVDSSDPTPHTAQQALRAVELSLEDQIYRLFRRTWIITNNSGNSITALPSSQQYVYLLSPHQRQQAVANTAADVLDHLCDGTYKEDPLPHGLTLNGVSAYDNVSEVLLLQECAAVRGGGGRKKKRAILDLLAANLMADMVTDTEANMEHRFSTFVQQHIDLALGDGFDDNIGRGAPAPVFVLPKVKTWFAAANRLYNFFVLPEHDPQVSPTALASLSPCSPQLQLLRLACQQTGHAALQQYRDHLPRYYARHVHRTKVRECLALYDASSCSGAMARRYRERLVADCEEEWRGGRQGCEQLSLSGHTCQHGRHQHPTTLYRGAVIPSHNFGVSFLKFCNCGHRGGKLPDSSVLRHMNYDFYAELLTICCERLECYRFPSLETEPSTVWVPAAPKTKPKSSVEPSFPPVPSGLDGVGVLTTSLCRRLRLEQEASQRSGGVYTPWDPVCERIPVESLDGSNTARTGREGGGGHLSDDHQSYGSDGHRSNGSDHESYGSEVITDGDANCEQDDDDAHKQGEDSDSLVELHDEDSPALDSGSLADERMRECVAESSSSVGSCSNNTQTVGSKRTQQQPSVSRNSNPAANPHLLDRLEDSFMLNASGGDSEDVGEQEEAVEEESEDGGDEYQQLFQMEPMLSSESPDGFLPEYTSWSLTCVGPSSLYSHNIGIIDQPGFISGSNYLLPWDVKVKVNNKSQWCAIADSFSRKNKEKMNISSDEFCVKLFLGMEYECGQGHRFLMSSPSTVLMCPTSQPTTSAHSIATSAMPLYCKCLCSKNSPSPSEACLGQLMRLHVITPKAPVNVELRPQVAPGPAPCPRYFPQPPSAPRIQLSSAAYWVLRLPNIYVSATTGPYYPPDPTQPVTVHNGHLLPGCFSITEAPIDK